MGVERLRERLDALAGEPQGALRDLRDQWIADVSNLYDQIERWLKALPEVTLQRAQQDAYEEEVGRYKVEHAYITFGVLAAAFELKPVGVQVVGARLADGRFVQDVSGRVTLRYGARSLPIVRRAGTHEWQISTPDMPDLHPLTEDSLVDALVALVPELGG